MPAREPALRSGLPHLPDRTALARAMGIPVTELDWLADPYRIVAPRAPHYSIRALPKRNGGKRLVLAPKTKLKAAQRWILRNILDRLEAPPFAHGFVRGRSTSSNAEPHVGQEVVVGMDLHDFFHQFTYKQVIHLFRRLGYRQETARYLSFLTTAPVRWMAPAISRATGIDPVLIWPERRWLRINPFHPCLPQGAPTSPALANLLCVGLDRRMAGLARRFQATYTRYADDLTFSGGPELRRGLRRFIPLATRIIRAEGLNLSPGKLRVARKGGRQTVTGIVVNRKINAKAHDYRTLRAILHNCVRSGPAGQNRANHPDFRAHLQGRIAWVRFLNPDHGARLQSAFDRIRW